MLSKATGSVAARIAVLGLTAGTLLLNARMLGAAGLGEVALLQLGLLLSASLGGLIAGGAVVYLAQRAAWEDLVVPAHLWLGAVAVGTGAVLPAVPGVSVAMAWTVAGLGWLQGIVNFHGQVAVARGNVRFFNALQLCQTGTTALLLAAVYGGLAWRTPAAFAAALGSALGLTALGSLAALRARGDAAPARGGRRAAARLLARHGPPASLGAVLQLAANRIYVALLGHGTAAGLFAVAWAGTEAVWSVARGVAPLVHAESARERDAEARRARTRFHLAFAAAGTALLVAVAVALPDRMYAAVFGFEGVAAVVRAAAGASLAGGVAPVLSHHLSGRGLHRWNAWTSGLGLAVGVAGAVAAIPAYGAVGAAWAASAGAVAQTLGLAAAYRRTEGRDAFRFRRADFRLR